MPSTENQTTEWEDDIKTLSHDEAKITKKYKFLEKI